MVLTLNAPCVPQLRYGLTFFDILFDEHLETLILRNAVCQVNYCFSV